MYRQHKLKSFCYNIVYFFQGINIADACKQAGVYHLVFSGLENVQKTIGIACPHFDGKGEVEEYLQVSHKFSELPFCSREINNYSTISAPMAQGKTFLQLLYITVAALCNAHGQCDQIFVKVGDGRLRQ